MKKYELLYILDSGLTEEARKGAIDKFKKFVTAAKAENVKVDEWGMKKLAYPINYKNEGYYVLMTFESQPNVPGELNKQILLNESVIRSNIAAR